MVTGNITCIQCGLQMPRKRKSGTCDKCLIARPCKNCGKPVNQKDPRQKMCSAKCGYDNRSLGKVVVQCFVCGKNVERYTRHFNKFNKACCSLDCQRQHSIVDNRGHAKINWVARSKLMREIWSAESSQARKGFSVAGKWWSLCQKNCATYSKDFSVDAWDKRCCSAIVSLHRRVFSQNEGDDACITKTWSLVFATVTRNLKARCYARARTGWDARCTSAASIISKRIIN